MPQPDLWPRTTPNTHPSVPLAASSTERAAAARQPRACDPRAQGHEPCSLRARTAARTPRARRARRPRRRPRACDLCAQGHDPATLQPAGAHCCSNASRAARSAAASAASASSRCSTAATSAATPVMKSAYSSAAVRFLAGASPRARASATLSWKKPARGARGAWGPASCARCGALQQSSAS